MKANIELNITNEDGTTENISTGTLDLPEGLVDRDSFLKECSRMMHPCFGTLLYLKFWLTHQPVVKE